MSWGDKDIHITLLFILSMYQSVAISVAGAEMFWGKQLFLVCLFSLIEHIKHWTLVSTSWLLLKILTRFGKLWLFYCSTSHACILNERIKCIMDKSGHVTLALEVSTNSVMGVLTYTNWIYLLELVYTVYLIILSDEIQQIEWKIVLHNNT